MLACGWPCLILRVFGGTGALAKSRRNLDWPSLFDRLCANRATYSEVYAPSFTRQHKVELARQIRRFAAHIRAHGPLMPKENSEP